MMQVIKTIIYVLGIGAVNHFIVSAWKYHDMKVRMGYRSRGKASFPRKIGRKIINFLLFIDCVYYECVMPFDLKRTGELGDQAHELRKYVDEMMEDGRIYEFQKQLIRKQLDELVVMTDMNETLEEETGE